MSENDKFLHCSKCASLVHPVTKQLLRDRFGDYSGFPLSAISPAMLILKHKTRFAMICCRHFNSYTEWKATGNFYAILYYFMIHLLAEMCSRLENQLCCH